MSAIDLADGTRYGVDTTPGASYERCPFGGGPVTVVAAHGSATTSRECEDLFELDSFIEVVSGPEGSGPVPLEGWPSRCTGALDLNSRELFVVCELLDSIDDTIRGWCES